MAYDQTSGVRPTLIAKMFGAKIFGENIFGEQMFGGFFIKSPKISVNNFGEKGF